MSENLIAFFEAVGAYTYLQVNLLRLVTFDELVDYRNCEALHYEWMQRQKKSA